MGLELLRPPVAAREFKEMQFNRIIKGAPPPLSSRAIDSVQLWVKQRNALIRDNWEALEKLANQGLGDAYAAYRELMRTLGTSDALNREVNGHLATLLKFHAGHEDTREEFFAEMKKELLRSAPNTSRQQLAALDALGKGNLGHNRILESLEASKSEDSQMDDALINSTVALFTRSLMALTHGNFNRHYKKLTLHPLKGHRGELQETFRQVINAFEESLDANCKRLHAELTKHEPAQLAAERLAAHIEDALPEFGRVQASLSLYIDGLKEAQASAGLLETLGRLSAKASGLTRSAFAIHAAAYYLCLQSKALNKDPKAKKILEGDPHQGYEAPFPNGRDVELAEVKNIANGTYIEVRGFVSALTARRGSDRKLISLVTLTDASGSAQVEVVGIFVQLRNVGLLEGAYCQGSGIWKTKSSINRGKPAIEIEQLRINELAKASWKVELEDLADKFVDRWPGGLNIAFGLSPHLSGGPEGKSKRLGAGELIFRPFFR
jgi:hypothetical protein